MYDIFDCVKAQIYYNPNKKSLAEIKRETGCTHAINGYLFNKKFNPVEWCVIDGKVISTSKYNDYGFCLFKSKPVFSLASMFKDTNFLSGIPILIGGLFVTRDLTPDVAREAQRTAVGWTKERKIILFCSPGRMTREQLQCKMKDLGAYDALMLDGGGSTQCIFGNKKIYSSRRVPTVLLFWNKEVKKDNNTSDVEGAKNMYSVNVYNASTEGATKITNNFKVSEFKSDSKIVLIHHTLPIALQMIREKIGKAINITNAYRTETHNERVGGASNSFHLYGMAADIWARDITPVDLAKVIDSLFPTTYGVIAYPKKGIVHFDVRAKKYRAINNGTEVKVEHF